MPLGSVIVAAAVTNHPADVFAVSGRYRSLVAGVSIVSASAVGIFYKARRTPRRRTFAPLRRGRPSRESGAGSRVKAQGSVETSAQRPGRIVRPKFDGRT